MILKLSGIDDMDRANRLKGAVIRIPPDKALPLGEDEYYHRDLIGMEVFTREGERLGELSEIIETGANDVYAVKTDGAENKLLIPAIKGCIIGVDTDKKIMTVSLPEGLRGL